MFKNYFKTAWRNLLRNKSYAAINVIGPAVGIATSLLIFLVVEFETSFDTFHKKKDQIYRVVSEFNGPEGKSYSAGAPFPAAEALRIDYPQIKLVAAINSSRNGQISISENNDLPVKKFKEETGVFYAEPQFFEMFDFKWLAGDAKTALKEPNTGVLTKETAERYFGDWKKAMGKSIKHENKNIIKITGILDNVPANTDFPLKVVISYATLKNPGSNYNFNDWVSVSSNWNFFISKPASITTAHFNSFLASFVKKHKPPEYATDGLILQPLKEIHYDERFGNFSRRTFGRDLITALTLIGIFLLVIACVNFINLATAQAVNRAKEIGIRKVLGATVTNVITLLSKDFLRLVAISSVVAFPLAWWLMHNWLQGFAYRINISWWVFVIAGGLAVVIALLTVSFQAIKAALANPVKSLRTE